MEEPGIEQGFPADVRTKETADLFLVLIKHILKPGGRAALVLPDGTLFGERVKTRLKEQLLTECKLHTIVRLPNGVFAPYTGIKTNLLFFTKGQPTTDVWYYEHPYPLIQTGEVSRAKGIVQEVHSYYSDIGLAQSRMWPKGTLCITIVANIAESAILGFDSCFPDSVVGFVPADAMGNVEYFLLFVETAKADLMAFAPATAQKNINLEILSSLLIPVPPLNELTRIVARVASLRALCADLRQRLTTAPTQQALLAEVLVQKQ